MSSSIDNLVERLSTAARHVLHARNIIARQENVIDRLRRAGHATTQAEHLLVLFKHTLDLFEADYTRLKQEFDAKTKEPGGL